MTTKMCLHEGTLRDGKTFKFPETMSVTADIMASPLLMRPGSLIWLIIPAASIISLFLYFNHYLSVWFFVFQHIAWRLAYNLGIGYILYTQSNGKRFQKFFARVIHKSYVKWFLERSVIFSDHSEFRVANYPEEFGAWMLFRQLENAILACDFMTYITLFVVCTCENIDQVFWLSNVPNILLAILLSLFSLWSKVDAHRVIGEFAWYWGDFFFLEKKSIVFDGIFQMFPHPMYTVGYMFVYALPLINNSFLLLWVGIFSHVCQILFLVFVEQPHIQKVYGEPCTPATLRDKNTKKEFFTLEDQKNSLLEKNESFFLLNLSLSRVKDIVLLIFICIHFAFLFFAVLPVSFFIAEFVICVILRYGVLGRILYLQGKKKWLTKMFRSPRKAFSVWKAMFNTCQVMVFLSFFTCALLLVTSNSWLAKTIRSHVFYVDLAWLLFITTIYYYGSFFLTAGTFGYYFGDFFLNNVQSEFLYDGIFRYFNFPQIFVGVGLWYCCGIISGNFIVLFLAALHHVCLTLFTLLIEKPHFYAFYTNAQREGGFEREFLTRLNAFC